MRGPRQNPKDEGVWDLSELEKSEDKAIKPTQWGSVGSRMYKGFSATHEKLPKGAYSISLDRNDERPIFIRKDVKTDDIISFKDSLAAKIMAEIETFWLSKDKFSSLGVLHRRGYLLYGPQGTGKSSLVQQITVDVVKRDGVVLICDNPKFFNLALSTFRQAEPGRHLVCIFEDIDAIIKKWGEDEILSILDGSNMVDGVLNIATTNYPELLDKRIVSRPRRFDRVMKILAPSDEVRKEYLKIKLPKGEKMDVWVKETTGLSFAAITEAIISVFCLGNSFEETMKVLKDMENGHPNSSDFGTKGNLGFGGPDKDEPEGDDDD